MYCSIMNTYEKIEILGPSAQYDTCGPRDLGKTTRVPGVYYAKTGGGGVCRLFKVLQTNACKNNCRYCAFRRDRSCKRIMSTPDEMAQAFLSVLRKRLVDGLFLSSGITNTANTTMSRMLDTVTILRKQCNYHGYIHLKIMPGSSRDIIEEAVLLANRVSINVEAPTETTLSSLSPDKHLKNELVPTLQSVVREIRKRKEKGVRSVPSLTTQFIVGAGEEKDKHLIEATQRLYKKFGLARVFYSSFRPVDHTPLAEKPPSPLIRQNWLYQTDFLMRFYHFSPSDIPLDENGNLSLSVDPKTHWAKNHPEYYPVNINTAPLEMLIRVPGIGPLAAKKILTIRKKQRISSVNSLLGYRIRTKQLPEWITF